MTEPSRTRVTEEELTYHVIDDRRAIRSPWGKGNSKIGRGIYTYSRLPVVTCPGATELCKEVCYSKRIVENIPLFIWMQENTYQEGLPPLPSDAKIVRIHVSGDFDAKEYIEAWDRLCCENPKIQFFGYTRSWRVPELLPCLELLKSYVNMELFASMDSATPEEPPEGWRVAWLVEPHSLSGFLLQRSSRTIVCPEEMSTQPNCEVCGYCFRAKRGDVIFELREL